MEEQEVQTHTENCKEDSGAKEVHRPLLRKKKSLYDLRDAFRQDNEEGDPRVSALSPTDDRGTASPSQASDTDLAL